MKEGKLKKSNTLKFFAAIFIAIFVFSNFNFVNITNAGVPKILSFQGRLTDSSGNLLGSSGTNFYFKFAIFDSLSGGTQLWPSDPIASSATITSKVTQGVFNTLLGDTTAGFEAISLDFATSNYFLEVRVSELGSTFDTLTPRQRIVSSGFAINADTVHGGLFINATGVGQFGGLATVAYSRFGRDETSNGGTINASNDLLISGGLEVNSSAAFDGFVAFGANASVSGFFDITNAISSGAQFKIKQSSTLNAGFYVDSSGDLTLSTTGGDIKANDNNLWVCIGSCDLEATHPTGDGNIIVENAFYFDNDYKFKQSTATISWDDPNCSEILQFDQGQ